MINPGIAYIDCADYPAIALTGPNPATGAYTGAITNPDFIKKLSNTHGKIVCIKNWKYTNGTISPRVPSGMLDGIYMQAYANGYDVLKAACGGAGATSADTSRPVTVDIIFASATNYTVVVAPITMGTQSA